MNISYLIRALNRAFGIEYWYYIAAAFSFVLCFRLCKGKTNKRIAAGFITAYVVLLFSSTVFARPTSDAAEFRLKLFWTYGVIANGGWRAKEMATQVLVNITMMVPLGLFLPIFIKKNQLLWTLICGLAISIMIEVLQLIFRRGLPEIDDLIYNTIGVVLGLCLYKGAKYAFQKIAAGKH